MLSTRLAVIYKSLHYYLIFFDVVFSAWLVQWYSNQLAKIILFIAKRTTSTVSLAPFYF